MNKSFFTYAEGNKYLSLAFTLARSYRFHNDISLPFYIASRIDFNLPIDLKWVKKIIVPDEVAGKGLEFKLRFLEIMPTTFSIFIDADSLIYGDIHALFDQFNGDTPNVIGLKVTDGTWVDENISSTCQEFGLSYMIRYCGALYYLVNNETGQKVFTYARLLYASGRGFQRNGHTTNDEPMLSTAMAKYNIAPLPDDGNLWGDLVQFNDRFPLNIFKGPGEFNNIPGSKNYKSWLPDGRYRPKILHVGNGNYNKQPWLFDALRLKLRYKFLLPVTVSNVLVKVFAIPGYYLLKKLLAKK